MEALYDSRLSLPLIKKGKVRDLYEIDAETMLVVATDRLSAFDVVLPQPIPGKGKILNRITDFWFDKTAHIIPNHRAEKSLDDILSTEEKKQIEGRTSVVRKLKPLPIEAIVRGYLAGSMWQSYQKTGQFCDISLPAGLTLGSPLPGVLFTPSTKAEDGDHDVNISFAEAGEIIGEKMAKKVCEISLALYRFAAEYAKKCGIIIADTKFEFGIDEQKNLILIDEILTPDSSRFWLRNDHRVGKIPENFDKQIIRDYLRETGWDKKNPPEIPAAILQKTKDRYLRLSKCLWDD